MELAYLIHLLETDEGQKEINRFLEMPSQGQTEWTEGLLSNLQEIIPSNVYLPMVRLRAIYLLKLCLEAGSDIFNQNVQKGTILEELTKYAIIQSKIFVFDENADEEQQISVLITNYIVEGFLFWSTWFPGTKFEKQFKELQTNCVEFPVISKLVLFDAGNLRLYVNGKFQRKQGKELNQSLAQQSSVLDQSQMEGKRQISAVHQAPYLSSNDKVEQLIKEYDQKMEEMFGMLENLENADELTPFYKAFQEFNIIADGSLVQNQSLKKDQFNKLMEKADQYEQICIPINNFYKDKKQFPFSKMKEELQALHRKQMLQSARQTESQYQQKSIVSSESETKNESSRKLQEESSVKIQNEKQNQNSIVQIPHNLLISAQENNDSHQNDDKGLNHNSIAGHENKQDIQQVQKLGQTNSPILSNFLSEKLPANTSTNCRQENIISQSERFSNQRSPVPSEYYFEERQELTQQRPCQPSKVKNSNINEEQKTLPNENKNISKKNSSCVQDTQSECLDELLEDQTYTINEFPCFVQPQSKPKDFQPINHNQNEIISENKNGNGNSTLHQSQLQSVIQECEKYLKGQSSSSQNMQHKDNYYSSQEDLSQIKSQARTTGESFYGGKGVNQKINKTKEEKTIEIEQLTKTAQMLLSQIKYLEPRVEYLEPRVAQLELQVAELSKQKKKE